MAPLQCRTLPSVSGSSDVSLAPRDKVLIDQEKKPKALRFLIIEDLPIFGVSLAEVIFGNFNAHVQVVSDARKGLDISATEELDLILLGVSVPEGIGLSSVAECDRFCANCPVLIVSLLPEAEFVPRALKACAAGYIMKSTSPEELVCAVECVLKGGRYVSGRALRPSAGSIRPPFS